MDQDVDGIELREAYQNLATRILTDNLRNFRVGHQKDIAMLRVNAKLFARNREHPTFQWCANVLGMDLSALEDLMVDLIKRLEQEEKVGNKKLFKKNNKFNISGS